jgi:pyruvate-formate lyase-activating enzyme
VCDLRADHRGQRYQGGSATNMELVKLPRFELLSDVNDYAKIALQFSRGCPFKCEFCDIIEIHGRVPRTKTSAQICAELTALERFGFQGGIGIAMVGLLQAIPHTPLARRLKAEGRLLERLSSTGNLTWRESISFPRAR